MGARKMKHRQSLFGRLSQFGLKSVNILFVWSEDPSSTLSHRVHGETRFRAAGPQQDIALATRNPFLEGVTCLDW